MAACKIAGRFPGRWYRLSIQPSGVLHGEMRLPGTKGAEKCILGEDKGKSKVRLVCRCVLCWDPAGRMMWLKNPGVVQGKVGKTGPNYEEPGMPC